MQTASQPTNSGYLKVLNPIRDLRPTRLKSKKTCFTKIYRHKIFRSDEELRNPNKHLVNGNG